MIAYAAFTMCNVDLSIASLGFVIKVISIINIWME